MNLILYFPFTSSGISFHLQSNRNYLLIGTVKEISWYGNLVSHYLVKNVYILRIMNVTNTSKISTCQSSIFILLKQNSLYYSCSSIWQKQEEGGRKGRSEEIKKERAQGYIEHKRGLHSFSLTSAQPEVEPPVSILN